MTLYKVVSILVFLFVLNFTTSQAKVYRSIDGKGVHPTNTEWGSSGTPLLRKYIGPSYTDGFNEPAGLDRPSARELSNILGGRQNTVTRRRVSDFHTFWAQFMSIDLVGRSNNATEPYLISVPECDPVRDPLCEGNNTISFSRSAHVGGTSSSEYREQINTQTAYLDASCVYGPTKAVSDSIRTFIGGKLKEDWNLLKVPLVVNPQLAAINYVFVKEHNRLASQFAVNNPDWSDEILFQEARRWVIAFYQKISTREYLAALLGKPLDFYRGFNASVDPTLDNFFSVVTFRYAHSELATIIPLVNEQYKTIIEGNYLMRDCWGTKPGERCLIAGIEPLLRGMTVNAQNTLDLSYIDDIRNYAIAPKYGFGLDLFSLDIQRARDHGLPDYNSMRVAFGLPRYSNFSQITNDTSVQKALFDLYDGNIDDIDPAVGAYAEDHLDNSNFGPLYWNSMYDQINALRDGDPLWYENGQFTDDELAEIYGTTMAKIVQRNTNITNIPENVFFISDRQLTSVSNAFLYSTKPEYTNFIDLSTMYRLSWFVEGDEIQMMIQASVTGWVAVGFEPDLNTMKNSDIIMARVFTDINGQQITEVHDCFALDVGVPKFDSEIGGTNDIIWYSGSEVDGLTTVEFRRKWTTNDKYDKPIRDNSEMKVIFAFNPDTDEYLYHGPTRSANSRINFRPVSNLLMLEAYAESVRIAIFSLAGIGMALVCTLVFLIIRFRDKFFFYSPIFCLLIAIGGFFGYLHLILIALPKDSATCTTSVWSLGYAFILIYGSLFTKTWRIHRIMTESEKLHRITITDIMLLKIVGVLLLLETIYLAIWSGADTPHAKEVEDNLADHSLRNVCASDSSLFSSILIALDAVLLFGGVWLAYSTRNAPAEVNESRTVGVSIYTVAIISIICIPMIIFLTSLPTATMLIQAIAVWLIITATLLLLFVPKLIAPEPLVDGVPVSVAKKEREHSRKENTSEDHNTISMSTYGR